MWTALLMGALVATGVIILSHKLGIRKIAGNDVVADVAISTGLAVLFAGTISGLMTAAIAGIMISLYLMAVKSIATVERLTMHGWEPVIVG